MKFYIFAFIPLIFATPRSKRQVNPGTIIKDIQSAAQYYNISNDVLNHGCHCQGLQKKPAYGVPVDHKDFLCRSWMSARSCVLLSEGPCNGVVDTSYDVSNGCDALNGCSKSLCEIDQNFKAMIGSENSTSITNPVCERHQTGAKDSCCGSSHLNYQKFNSKEHYCEADKLVSLESRNVLPDFIQAGLRDGKWYKTPIGHYIHIGEKSCSVKGQTCQPYCQGLGMGSNYAVPQTVEEYENYYQTIMDSTNREVVIRYGLRGTDAAWKNMKLCQTQPFMDHPQAGTSYTLGSAINAQCREKITMFHFEIF